MYITRFWNDLNQVLKAKIFKTNNLTVCRSRKPNGLNMRVKWAKHDSQNGLNMIVKWAKHDSQNGLNMIVKMD